MSGDEQVHLHDAARPITDPEDDQPLEPVASFWARQERCQRAGSPPEAEKPKRHFRASRMRRRSFDRRDLRGALEPVHRVGRHVARSRLSWHSAFLALRIAPSWRLPRGPDSGSTSTSTRIAERWRSLDRVAGQERLRTAGGRSSSTPAPIVTAILCDLAGAVMTNSGKGGLLRARQYRRRGGVRDSGRLHRVSGSQPSSAPMSGSVRGLLLPRPWLRVAPMRRRFYCRSR